MPLSSVGIASGQVIKSAQVLQFFNVLTGITTDQVITLGDGMVLAANSGAGTLTFGEASGRIIPGATQLSFRNNANSADNFIILNSGVVQLRSLSSPAPTTAGQLAYDSTQNALVYGNGTTTVNVGGGVPSGAIMAYGAGTTDPSGWFICDGRAVSRSTYSALFTAISTTYGVGDGSSTFNIPDLRSRVMMGADNAGTAAGAAGRASGNVALGNTSGADTSTALISHSHSHNHGSHQHVGLSDGGNFINNNTGPVGAQSGSSFTAQVGATAATANATITTDATTAGSGSSFSLRNLNQIINYIIKQ